MDHMQFKLLALECLLHRGVFWCCGPQTAGVASFSRWLPKARDGWVEYNNLGCLVKRLYSHGESLVQPQDEKVATGTVLFVVEPLIRQWTNLTNRADHYIQSICT
ncbi:hypothetical protein CHS0354_003649 [Potamilus streckersoni]|uniref:Secreted protein n=1 Tax=Potamilus streckersoni TaxID=2493646 RepID=A0AAE0VRN6_9BIVA|nr:hypothetical protein CHS0354_003649 [Potamilus streckersoni]